MGSQGNSWLNLRDAFSNEAAYIGVRVEEGRVGLTLSLEGDGDVCVFLGAEDCEQLIIALQRALSAVSEAGG